MRLWLSCTVNKAIFCNLQLNFGLSYVKYHVKCNIMTCYKVISCRPRRELQKIENVTGPAMQQ
jgi:hypothetical protein